MLTLPYVTANAFKAHPTFLDLLNLRSGDTSLADQTAELNNVLLMASAWADNYCEFGDDGTLAAHTKTETTRLRVDRQGRLTLHASHIPVQSLTALSYGYTPNSMLAVTDLSNTWIEDRRQIVAVMVTAAGLSNLQFGSPVYSQEVYTAWTYVAGYANTLLAAAAAQGATSIQVADATGITGGSTWQPPTTLRLWDPGSEEAVTVASTYTGGTTVPLTSPLANNHVLTNGPVGVSALPADGHLAVISYATWALMRPDADSEDQFPSAAVRSNAGGRQAEGVGLVEEAQRLLEPYRRVR